MSAQNLPARVAVFGASGTIGQAVAAALAAAGVQPICPLRPGARATLPDGAQRIDLATFDAAALDRVLQGGPAVLSCLAARSGTKAEAEAIDLGLNTAILDAAQRQGSPHFVLLSAICVQRPMLAFQHAKLAFEARLVASGMAYSIVRPTAFFKSLSGQVGRVRRGKPFVVFGDGTLTACKPISDADLARFVVGCLTDPARRNQILPIGGPGPALTHRAQGAALFAALGQTPRYRSVPIWMFDAIIGALSLGARLVPRLEAKAEYARIGRYYATQSMLVWDDAAQRYDADATPETGSDTLAEAFRQMVREA